MANLSETHEEPSCSHHPFRDAALFQLAAVKFHPNSRLIANSPSGFAFLRWLFQPNAEPMSLTAMVKWWELRRIPCNLIIGCFGILCLLIFYAALDSSGHLARGDDAVEPLALLAAPFIINVCYTFGWVVEISGRTLQIVTACDFGPRLLRFGLVFSMSVVALPALIWTSIWLLQLLHILQRP